MSHALSMMSGAIVAAAVLVSLFFLRFFRHTRDPFFLYFALAFLLQAAARLTAGLGLAGTHEALPYISRLLSYLLIVLAIWSKNRSRRGRPREDTPL